MTTSHLDADAVARAAGGTLTDSEREGVLGHLDGCPSCRADVTYAASFERRARNRKILAAGGVLAAALAAVVVLPLDTPPQGPSSDPVAAVRSGDEGVLQVPVHAPERGAVVDADSIRFAWGSMGDGAQYRLWVSTATGAPVWNRALSDTVAYLDATVPLEGGGRYLWFVDALLDDGGTAQSDVRSFTVRE